MLNTNHWANILQPESNQVLLGISCPSIKVSFSPDFSAKKPRKLGNPRPIKKIEKPKKPPAIKPPKKMFTSAKIAQYLTEIYPAGESPIEGVNGKFLLEKVKSARSRPSEVFFDSDLEGCADRIARDLKNGDLVLCMGAGSVTKLPDLIVSRLGK
jgi:hypothetical protein